MDELLSTKEAAKLINVSPENMRKWRERKLFGCVFFSADEKRGKKWYYKRERVEQLAAVYQKGILADLVKLSKDTANTVLVDGQFIDSTVTTLGHFTVTTLGLFTVTTLGLFTVTNLGHFSVTNLRHHGYFSTEDVANIFSVTVRTIRRWVKDKTLRWDRYDHANKWLFKKETVEEFAKRGAKQRSAKNQVTSAITNTITDAKQTRIEMALKHFNLLYGGVTERKYGYLWVKRDDEKITFPFDVSTPENRHAMAVKAVECSDDGFDVYCSVNLTDTQPAANARATAEQVTLQIATVTDIDIAGGKHISNETKKYPPTFDTAKSFLPFPASILVNSGYGLHGLCIYDVPIIITAENRHIAEARNKEFLDVIRRRAGIYSKAIDGVGDLPRVFRVPGTRNYKLGVSNDAPICHIVEDSGLRFTPDEIDEKLNALVPKTIEPQIEITKTSNTKQPPNENCNFVDDKDFNIFRVRRMLDFIDPSTLTYDEWLAVGMALKNIGCDCFDWEQWSRNDNRFKDGECESKWNGFNRDGYDFGTLYHFATPNGYDAKEIYREWYDLHPNLKPSAKRNMADETKRELDDAIIWINTLDPEKFTANDARDFKHIHFVALAVTYGFVAASEKFFTVIKKAKELARIRLRDAESGLTEKLSETENNEINALIEGVHIETIRRFVDREVTALSKAHSDFLKTETRRKKHEEAKKKQAEEIAQYKSNEEQLKELLAMSPSIERDVKVVQIINELCEWRHDRLGNPVSVKGTQANMDLIFNDPALNGLIGYDEFQHMLKKAMSGVTATTLSLGLISAGITTSSPLKKLSSIQ